MTETEALKSENNSLKDIIRNNQAEKTSLDMMLGEAIKLNHQLRTSLLLNENKLNELHNIISKLNVENSELKSKLIIEENVETTEL